MVEASIDLTRAEVIAARRFVATIFEAARTAGIDQATLASRTGISPESLTRLKKAGSCRLTTVLELARAAGFKTLDLTTPTVGHVATSVAARKLSAGRRLPISAEEFISAIVSGEVAEQHKVHLYGFFEELPIELVHDVILDENLDYEQLVLLAHELGIEGETVDWLKEMAGDRVANAA